MTKTTPTYDIVQEYVKSLDEYRNAKHPSDEDVAGIILEIADFLLEFATLGHEAAADVPSNIHPKLLSEDMRTIGVPHVVEDGGHSVLCYPYVLQVYDGDDGGDDGDGDDIYFHFCLSKYEDYDYFIDVIDTVSIILLLLLLLLLSLLL